MTLPQTRQKIKEAYAAEFAATIERAEKQIILARHGRRLLNLLDDSPVVPGDVRPAFEHASQARQVLNDAEDDLRMWEPELEDVPTHANRAPGQSQLREGSIAGESVGSAGAQPIAGSTGGTGAVVPAETSRVATGTSGTSVATGGQTYAASEGEASTIAPVV